MKKLFLLRHGEAGFVEGSDFQRPLTPRGITTIKKVGAILQESIDEIDLMYCSPAQRTRETAELLGKYVLIKNSELQLNIYSGDLSTMMQMIDSTPDEVSSCLIVGHNPVISLMLSSLSDSEYINLSPGNLAILEFDVESWKLIISGSGDLREIIN